MADIYKRASREDLLFHSVRGAVTVAQLWGIKFTGDFSLNAIAIAVSDKIKAATQESFVETNNDPELARNELRLEILKDVIATRKDELLKRTEEMRAQDEIRRLKAEKASRAEAAPAKLTDEELDARIAELSKG